MNTEIRFTYDADVVVCGGGVAGCMAAIAAANEGKSVVLIEQFGSVGGSATMGLVTPLMFTGIPNDPMCSYISEDLNRRMVEYGGAHCHGRFFDPMMMKIILEEMLGEKDIKIYYHTFICGVEVLDGALKAIDVCSKSGFGRIGGQIFIDATGDGDVGALAGAAYQKGDEESGKNQPVSLRYIVSGIDVRAFHEYIMAHVKEEQRYPYDEKNGQLETAMTLPQTQDFPLAPVFYEAIEQGDLIREDAVYWQTFYVAGRRESLSFNNPEFFDHTDGTRTEDLTYVQLEGKKAILRQMKFYKKYFRGFENAYLSEIAPMVGIRESRRLETDYILQAEDVISHRKFADAICRCNYPVDIHGKKLRLEHFVENPNEPPYYEIPYRCLSVKGFANLLTAGRSVGSDFVAQSSMRIQPTCRATGEAAGIAAALAIDKKLDVHAIDGAWVFQKMRSHGAQFE